MASSTNNYLVTVPKLKGRENYSEWAFAAENYLILENMLHCIKPDADKKIEVADDAKTKAKLILTIHPSLYVHVKEVSSSKSLWDKLRTLFDDSGFTRRISLLRSLISIRLESSSSMTSYVTQIVETSQKLNGTGFSITDEWVGSLLLAGLTDKYMPMIMAIEHSGISITTDSIKSKLMDMEENSDHSELNEVSGTSAAFFSRGQHSRKNKNVGSVGSPATASEKNHGGGSSNVNNNKSKSDKSKIRCYRCNEYGHYKNQCNSSSPVTKNNHTHSQQFFSAQITRKVTGIWTVERVLI